MSRHDIFFQYVKKKMSRHDIFFLHVKEKNLRYDKYFRYVKEKFYVTTNFDSMSKIFMFALRQILPMCQEGIFTL